MTGPLITTTVKVDTHLRCGAPVLTGHAEGLLARVDLTPLNQTGEIHALCAGLQTYTLTRLGLVHRNACRIAGTALRDVGPVLAQHRCHRRIPADHAATTAPTVAAVVDPDTCPY
ncbi:hypothetical protein DKT68_15390 [Micromonospora acroterricola]|uniref:Uncharacterized protein n=1 Tax=Micromonospora acroterricola TaxID=2202421 RepID=A0A317D4C3_9ACTN|nr:hypothetical protein [Micromonospora acroterricola]PWR08596.1 hypothetical protein DKT68_15390 [Micromonospora acroterricola]